MILNIDLVSDFVCPWCFLGAVRLDRALAELRTRPPDIEPLAIQWLPFFLNGHPPAGEPYATSWRQFGQSSEGRAVAGPGARGCRRRRAAGTPSKHIATRPNTLAAHRLLYRAQARAGKPGRVRCLARAVRRRTSRRGATSATSTPGRSRRLRRPPRTGAQWLGAAPMPTKCSAWPPDCVARGIRGCSSSSTAASACRAHSPTRGDRRHGCCGRWKPANRPEGGNAHIPTRLAGDALTGPDRDERKPQEPAMLDAADLRALAENARCCSTWPSPGRAPEQLRPTRWRRAWRACQTSWRSASRRLARRR